MKNLYPVMTYPDEEVIGVIETDKSFKEVRKIYDKIVDKELEGECTPEVLDFLEDYGLKFISTDPDEVIMIE